MMGSEPPTGPAEDGTRGTGPPRALRLLFVEDDDDFQQVLRVLLSRVSTRQPVESVFLSNISDAQRVVEATEVDAIVSDYHLPDGNGVEFLDHARRTMPRSHRVILTGAPDVARTTKSFDRSVQRLWDKSLNTTELQSRIQHLVHEMNTPAA
jgi:DNA-binding NtrC family response regulator